MRIGTMSILFREQLGTDAHISLAESMRRSRKAGFEVMDLNLCQICGHKTRLHLDNWQEEADEILKTQEELSIALPQCHLPFKSNKVKWQTPEDYAYYTRMFYRAIDVAAYLGIPWAVIHPDRYKNHPEWTKEQRFQQHKEEYAPLVDYALKKGLKLALENMPGTADTPEVSYCANAEELVELIDSYRDDRIGACWDTGHAGIYYGADQWDALHVVGHRLHCTHIHDNRLQSDLHLLPWEGMIDWPRVMAALRDIGYPGDLILEGAINYFSPNELKEENGRHAYAVMQLLSTL